MSNVALQLASHIATAMIATTRRQSMEGSCVTFLRSTIGDWRLQVSFSSRPAKPVQMAYRRECAATKGSTLASHAHQRQRRVGAAADARRAELHLSRNGRKRRNPDGEPG